MNVADQQQVRLSKKAAKKRRELELLDMRELLKSPSFHHFLRRYLSYTNVFSVSDCGEQTHLTSFREGQRSVGLKLITDIEEADPEKIVVILKDHAKETHSGGRENNGTGDEDDDSASGGGSPEGDAGERVDDSGR
jgi:hypothetical protein